MSWVRGRGAYVSDKVFIVLHKGPGADYRWAAKLTPGTRLTVAGKSSDGEWAEVTTTRGTSGWVRAEFLTSEAPAQIRLPAALASAEKLTAANRDLTTEVQALQTEKVELLNTINASESELGSVSEELARLKQISDGDLAAAATRDAIAAVQAAQAAMIAVMAASTAATTAAH